MSRYAQIVIGPAGCGKSTYCNIIQKHCEALKRTVHVVNLDPAAEKFEYSVLADIRELIDINDVMDDEDLKLGPNGGLMFCMEHLVENLDWLKDALDDMEDDYILFDCPGQIELYTHSRVMARIIEYLTMCNFSICTVFVLDSQFLLDSSKFVSGMVAALASMVNLETPHVNILSKLDLLDQKSKKHLEKYLDPDAKELAEQLDRTHSNPKFSKLNKAIARVIDDFSLVQFLPLDMTDEDSINDVLMRVDGAIQYGENLEPKEPRDEIEEREEYDSGTQMDDPISDFCRD